MIFVIDIVDAILRCFVFVCWEFTSHHMIDCDFMNQIYSAHPK